MQEVCFTKFLDSKCSLGSCTRVSKKKKKIKKKKKVADLPTLFFCGLKPETNLFFFWSYEYISLNYHESDFYKTWWKCLNFGPIACIKILLRYASRALRYARVMGQKGKPFFWHFYLFHFQSIWSPLRHTFFSNIFE